MRFNKVLYLYFQKLLFSSISILSLIPIIWIGAILVADNFNLPWLRKKIRLVRDIKNILHNLYLFFVRWFTRIDFWTQIGREWPNVTVLWLVESWLTWVELWLLFEKTNFITLLQKDEMWSSSQIAVCTWSSVPKPVPLKNKNLCNSFCSFLLCHASSCKYSISWQLLFESTFKF